MERADLPMIETVSLATGTQYPDAMVPLGARRRPVWWLVAQIGRGLGLDVLAGLDPDACTDRALLERVAAAGRAGADAVFAAGPRGIAGPAPTFGWVHDQVIPDGRWRLAPRVPVERLRAYLASLDAAPPEPALVLVPRRQVRSMNSARYEAAARRGEEQPLVRLSPEDAAYHGLGDGDAVTVTGARGATSGVVRVDERLRPGVVSMTHGWFGVNPGMLTSVVDEVDTLTGMICQSGIPVTRGPALGA
jgi:anaerobic selenocysteine-containing dehydrogenase